MTISTDPNTIFSVDEAINAFRSWASAELLNNQLRWLVAESRKQNRKKSEILRRVLVAWINRHPEAHVTNPQLFNIMRAATGEFIEQHRGSARGAY
jgi:hypothetical protein